MFERDELSLAGFGKIDTALRRQIEQAEAEARHVSVAPVLVDVAGPDVEARWAGLSLPQKREVIRTLMDVRLLPQGPGTRTFRPECVVIAWKL